LGMVKKCLEQMLSEYIYSVACLINLCSFCHLEWRTLVLKCNKNNYDWLWLCSLCIADSCLSNCVSETFKMLDTSKFKIDESDHTYHSWELSVYHQRWRRMCICMCLGVSRAGSESVWTLSSNSDSAFGHCAKACGCILCSLFAT
jgi:hypothetical protein